MRVSARHSIRHALLALGGCLVGLVAATAAAPAAQAAGTWSTPVQLPVACGGTSLTPVSSIAVNGTGAEVAAGNYQAADNTAQVQVCTSADGQTWSVPVSIGQGVSPSVAVAPDGRAVLAWEGGTPLASTVTASVRPPGGAWSTPVTLSTDFGHPVVGMDGSGNAVIAWAGASGAVYTASLPAGGTWTAPQTLIGTRLAGFHGGFNVDLAVNTSGAAIIVWNEYDTAIEAASGTVLGGFAAPVAVDGAYTKGLQPRVAINDTGSASLAWSSGTDNRVVTRTPAGTWSAPTILASSSGGRADTAIDANGNAIAIFETIQQGGITSPIPLYASWRPAGGTWGTPIPLATLTYPVTTRVVGDGAGTFVVAYADNTTAVNAFTVAALAGFGQPTAVGPAGLGDLAIGPGHVALVGSGEATAASVR